MEDVTRSEGYIVVLWSGFSEVFLGARGAPVVPSALIPQLMFPFLPFPVAHTTPSLNPQTACAT